MKKKIFIGLFLLTSFSTTAFSTGLPSFIDKDFVNNAEFKCLVQQPEYSPEEKKLVDILWKESLQYLDAYAQALTANSSNSQCLNSDQAITETNNPSLSGPVRQCIMENRDMQLLVKHIYAVLHNQEKAFKCFTPQMGVKGLYNPSAELTSASPVAQWLNRPSLGDYYAQNKNMKIKDAGVNFYSNFHKMVTGNEIVMPASFKVDISANKLPNLWASVGWVPMYSFHGSERNENAGEGEFRAGYAYGEVMGNWGLLQIDTINGEPVGAEIGMTVQAMGTFYPYHFHNIQEIYHTIRTPKCLNSIKQFVVGQNNQVLKVIAEDETSRTLEFNGSQTINVDHYWAATTPHEDALLYIPRNSIHAFNLKENCEATPEESAHVAVWARSTGHDKNNDYGTTLVCELKDKSLPKEAINRKDADVICRQSKFVY